MAKIVMCILFVITFLFSYSWATKDYLATFQDVNVEFRGTRYRNLTTTTNITFRAYGQDFKVDLALYYPRYHDTKIKKILTKEDESEYILGSMFALYQGKVKDDDTSFALGYFLDSGHFRGYIITDEVYAIESDLQSGETAIVYRFKDVIPPGCNVLSNKRMDCTNTKFYKPYTPPAAEDLTGLNENIEEMFLDDSRFKMSDVHRDYLKQNRKMNAILRNAEELQNEKKSVVSEGGHKTENIAEHQKEHTTFSSASLKHISPNLNNVDHAQAVKLDNQSLKTIETFNLKDIGNIEKLMLGEPDIKSIENNPVKNFISTKKFSVDEETFSLASELTTGENFAHSKTLKDISGDINIENNEMLKSLKEQHSEHLSEKSEKDNGKQESTRKIRKRRELKKFHEGDVDLSDSDLLPAPTFLPEFKKVDEAHLRRVEHMPESHSVKGDTEIADMVCGVEAIVSLSLLQYAEGKPYDNIKDTYLQIEMLNMIFRKMIFKGHTGKFTLNFHLESMVVPNGNMLADPPEELEIERFIDRYFKKKNPCLVIGFDMTLPDGEFFDRSGLKEGGGICSFPDNNIIIVSHGTLGKPAPMGLYLASLVRAVIRALGGTDNDPKCHEGFIPNPMKNVQKLLLSEMIIPMVKYQLFSTCNVAEMESRMTTKGACIERFDLAKCSDAIRHSRQQCGCSPGDTCPNMDPCCAPALPLFPDRTGNKFGNLICEMRTLSECSAKDPCCENCRFARAGKKCVSGTDSCDVGLCDGKSAACTCLKDQSLARSPCEGLECGTIPCARAGLKPCLCKGSNECLVCCMKHGVCQTATFDLKLAGGVLFAFPDGTECGSKGSTCKNGTCEKLSSRRSTFAKTYKVEGTPAVPVPGVTTLLPVPGAPAPVPPKKSGQSTTQISYICLILALTLSLTFFKQI